MTSGSRPRTTPRTAPRAGTALGGLALLAGLLATAGCGSPPAPGHRSEPQVKWASGVCRHLDTSGSRLTVPKLDEKRPAAARQQLVTFLTTVDQRLGAVRAAMKRDGAPPVSGGQAAFDQAMRNLDGVRARLGTATAGLAKAEVTDPASLRSALRTAGAPLRTLGTYQGPAHDLKSQVPELKKAFAGNPDCVGADGTVQGD
ncbi:hypothetical protein NX801_08680 [Streptomyces sp. LP05-1]|uniref:Lipoprotein n=1 Tax=Streptomyces pyxinae TaxID=2970734 RepID=A0ABT2CEA1_9ACTN|nr:hypothetical protein [Streptomyces sp. LP05-1]MCS0635737.1 hypothetical protein [Streptomyces sp. LP05-1]